MQEAKKTIKITLTGDSTSANKAVNKLNSNLESTGKATKKTSQAFDVMAGNIAASLVDFAAGAVVDFAKELNQLAQSFNSSEKKIAAALGVTGKEAKRLNSIVKDVWKEGFAGVEEANEVVIKLKRTFGDMSDNELSDATTKVIAISRTFGQDFNKTIDASTALVDEFGLSYEQSMDMISSGLQDINPAKADDLLDTFGEYSNLMAEAGFSAEEFYSILETGTKTGILGTDKIADAMKEFSTRIADGSDSTREALNDLYTAVGKGNPEVDRLRSLMESTSQEIETAEERVTYWENELDSSTEAVDKLSNALSTAKTELKAMATPNLAGVKKFEDAMFASEMQSKKLELQLLNMTDKSSAAFQQAAAQADAHNASIEAMDRAITSAEDSVDNATGVLDDWKATLKQSEENGKALENQLNAAKRALDNLSKPKLKGMEEYDDKLFELDMKAKEAKLALMDLDEGSPEYEAAKERLDKLNKQMDKVSLERDIELEPKLREIENAAKDGSEQALSYDEVLQQIGEKKGEISSLEKAIADNAVQTDIAQDKVALWENNLSDAELKVQSLTNQRDALGGLTTAMDELTNSQQYINLQNNLDAVNTEMQRLSLEHDITYAPQFRAISEAARLTQEPILTFSQAMTNIANKKTQIAGLKQQFVQAKDATANAAKQVDFWNTKLDTSKSKYASLESAMAGLDEPSKQLLDNIANGSISVRDALPQVLEMLNQIEDPIKRNEIGVALFGTQFEDMGAKAILGIDMAKSGMESLEGASNQVATGMKSNANTQTQAWREIQLALMPVAQEFNKLLVQTIVPLIQQYAPALAQGIKLLTSVFGTQDTKTKQVNNSFSLFKTFLDVVLTPLELLVNSVDTVIGIFVNFKAAIDGVIPIGKAFSNIGRDISRTFKAVVSPIKSVIKAVKKLSKVFDNLKKPDWLSGKSGGGFSIPGFARGGIAKAGEVATVGEEGRELIVPKQDVQVIPNKQTENILNNGSKTVNAPITININGNADNDVVNTIRNELRTQVDMLFKQAV